MGYPGIAGVPEDDAALEIMHYLLAGGGFEAIKVAFAEIEKMRANGLTPEEFEQARTAYLEGNIPHAYDFAHARVSRFAQHALWGFYEYTSEQR
jgi:hypothetical protein